MQLRDDSKVEVFNAKWTFDTLPKIRKRVLLAIADIDTIKLSRKTWLDLSCISLKMEIARIENEMAKI